MQIEIKLKEQTYKYKFKELLMNNYHLLMTIQLIMEEPSFFLF